MQLQLLKTVSGIYAEEAPALFLNDEDFTQHAADSVFHENCINNGENWKSTYINDVLIISGLEAIDQDTFMEAWYSPECPLDPMIYRILENVYLDDVTVKKKWERKLLFDGMNSAILEAFQELVDPRPWVRVRVRSVSGGFNWKWRSECVRDVLVKFIVQQEESCRSERMEKELVREMNWLILDEFIEVIGKEIEEMLVDELVGEVILA